MHWTVSSLSMRAFSDFRIESSRLSLPSLKTVETCHLFSLPPVSFLLDVYVIGLLLIGCSPDIN